MCVNIFVFVCSYQSSTAEQDHEDDEGFKPVVFHNQVAGFPQEPPVFAPAVSDGNITTLVFGHTLCMTDKNTTAVTQGRGHNAKCINIARILSIIIKSVIVHFYHSVFFNHLPSVQQASGSRYSSTTSTTATSSTSGLMSIVLPSDELVSSS